MSRSRRGLAVLGAALFLVPAASADAKPKAHGGKAKSAKKVKSPRADWDRDGLNNRYERLVAANPRKADSNGNGVRDGAEDRDRDGVDNRTEQLARLNPRKQDSNRNGVKDGAEDPDRDGLKNRGESLAQLNPRKRDTDKDRITDLDEHAGIVSAVSGTTVTVALAAGGQLTAALDDDTDLLCPASASSDDDSGDDEDEDAEDDGGFDDEADSDDPADDEADTDDEADADEADDEDAGTLFRKAERRRPTATIAIGDKAAKAPAGEVKGAVEGCVATVKVGQRVYEADVDQADDGSQVFLVLDLLGI